VLEDPALGHGPELGAYRIEALAGRGGMSVVYRAEDLRLGRRVALKLLAPELAEDERFRARFLTESRLAASIDHPGILPIYEAGEADGRLYIAMRYVEGTDLGALLRHEGRLTPARAVGLVAQLARALDVAHAHGLVHRDVKPSNALVAAEAHGEHVYLADFGLTKHAASVAGDTTADHMVGTVDYVSPEQIRGDALDARADVYSLGCLLYECLTGEVAFPRPSEVSVIYAHLEDEPPRPSERCADVPPALDGVVARALAKEPDERFQSAGELATAAQDALGPDAQATAATRPLRFSRRLAVGLGLASGAVAVAAAVALLSSGGGGPPLAAIDANSVAVIDPGKASLTAQVPIGASPARLAAGEGAVWATNTDDRTVSRIDPATHTVRQTIDVGSGPEAIAAGAGGVWAVNGLDGTVSWISPVTNRVVKTIPVGNGPSGVCVGQGAVWVADTDDRAVVAIDPDAGRVTKRIALDDPPSDLACGAGAVWASSESAGTVAQIDGARRQVVRSIPLGGAGAGALAVGAGGVWVANALTGVVSRIDPARGVVTATVALGPADGPAAIAIDGGGVWVANQFAGTIARIDPRKATVVRRLTVGNSPRGLALVDGALWVGLRASGAQHRGGTARVVMAVALGANNLDPATNDYANALTVLSTEYDGLTAFRRAGGRAGLAVVPDLAVALPEPGDGGRSYTFQLRRGVRYSTGALIRATDFRRGLERTLSARDSLSAGYFDRVSGAARCISGPAACDLSRGVVADDRAGTVVLHLTAPDPELLTKLALPSAAPVPAGTPPAGPDRPPPPGTGPYALVGINGNEVRLARNQHFRPWSAAARPDGYPDAITVRGGVDAGQAMSLVQQGAADYYNGLPTPEQVEPIRTRHPSQLHSSLQLTTQYFFLNARVPPFDDPSVRRALNYAVDRGAAVGSAGGASFARPTCQMLPPNLPGYRPHCPYTADAGAGQAWHAPDLATARRLVARSHTRGMRVSVWVPRDSPGFAADARHVAAALGALGYRAQVRTPPTEDYPTFMEAHRRVQIGLQNWSADYPAPSNFLQTLFGCRSRVQTFTWNWSRWCDPAMDRMMRRARRLQPSDPAAANAVWARVDQRIADRAAAVPMFTPQAVDVVSRRVGNYQRSPQWGILLDQLWVQ
jgi:YVTN family beta-propeller protein